MNKEYELFEVGDWVVWRFAPLDPNGPYSNNLNHWIIHTPGHKGETDPIAYELEHFEPPPYEVVRVLPVPEEYLELVGHLQFVVVRMFATPEEVVRGQPSEDLRHFSGKLFKRVRGA